jgi:hypothetical protein
VEEGDDVKGFVLELLATNCSILSLGSYHAKHIADPWSHRLHVHCKGGEALGSGRGPSYLEPTYDVIDTHRLGVTWLSYLCRSHRFITVVDARLADLEDGVEILKGVTG